MIYVKQLFMIGDCKMTENKELGDLIALIIGLLLAGFCIIASGVLKK